VALGFVWVGPAAHSAPSTLIDAVTTPALTLDPMFSTATITREIALHVFDQIVTYNENYQIVPDLATSWKVTPDKRVWTFALARGIKFQDGETMTSADVVASMNRYIEYGVQGAPLKAVVTSIKATDPNTVEVTLNKPSPNFLLYLAYPGTLLVVMPAKYAATTTALNPPNLIGTGPYRIANWVPDAYTELQRFDGYTPPSNVAATGLAGNRTAAVGTLRFQVVLVEQTRLNGIQQGTFQYAESLPYAAVAALRSSSAVRPYVIDPYFKPVFQLNQYHAPINNVWFRRALVASLDMTAILTFVTKNNPQFFRANASLFYPAQTDWYDPTAGAGIYNHRDLATARADLQKAGYHGETLTLVTNQDYAWMYDEALTAVPQWKDAGININLKVMTWPAQSSLAYHQGWDMNTSGYSFRSDPSYYEPMLLPGGSAIWGFDDPGTITPMQEGSAAADVKARAKAYRAVQHRFWTEIPYVQVGDLFSLDAGSAADTNGYRPWYLPRFWLVH
jgi:peptide/nickel transport system substrate-binding protein